MITSTIHIQNIQVNALIGIFEHERENVQPLIINIWITFNASEAIEWDQIQNTVDYDQITTDVINFTKDTDYFLIEKLTNEILNMVLGYEYVQSAKVKIDKPEALKDAESVSIEMEKTNE